MDAGGAGRDSGKPILRWSYTPVQAAWVPSWEDEVRHWAEGEDGAAPDSLSYGVGYVPEASNLPHSPILLRGETDTLPATLNGRETLRLRLGISMRRAVHYTVAGERTARTWDWRRQSPAESLETLDFEDGERLTGHYRRFGPLGFVNLGSGSAGENSEPLWWIRGCVLWMGFLRQLGAALVRRDPQLLRALLGPPRREADSSWDSRLGVDVARAYGERGRSTPASEREYYQEGWRILQVACSTVCDPLTERQVGRESASGREQAAHHLPLDRGVALSAEPLECYGSFVAMAAADLGIAIARRAAWAQCEHPPCDQWFPVHREGTRWCPRHRTSAARLERPSTPTEQTQEPAQQPEPAIPSRQTVGLASRLVAGARAAGGKVRDVLKPPRRRRR